MEEQEKELTPLDKARAEFARKHPDGLVAFSRQQEQQKTQSPPKVESTPPPVVEQTTKNDNEKKSAPADPEQDEKKESEEKKEKRKRRTREEIRADLQKRRDELNAQLAEMRAEDAKTERKQRNHRLITFAARFEKEIMAVCQNSNRQDDDKAIKILSAEIYKKAYPTGDTKKE